MYPRSKAALTTVVSVITLVLSLSSREGSGSELRLRPAAGRFRIAGANGSVPRVLARGDGLTVTSLTRYQARMAERLLGRARQGDGGGASVGDLAATQIQYMDSQCAPPAACGGPCNVVLLLWTETSLKPDGISIFEDGAFLGRVDSTGGQNGVNILGPQAGTHTYRILSTDNGTSDEADIRVLDNQPFGDAQNVVCAAEGTVDGEGTCRMEVTFENPGPMPDLFGVFVDDAFQGVVGGDGTDFEITGVPAGEHCVSLIGQVTTDEGTYRGCEVEACCTLDCTGAACNPPVDLLLCQVAYGPGDEDGEVLAAWTNPAMYEGGINGFRDGESVGSLPGDAEVAIFGLLSPGEHTFGVQGDCGAAGASSVTEDTIEVLTETPHTTPVDGDVVCEWTDADGGTTTATWTNADPSIFIDVFVFDGMELLLAGTITGDSETVSVTGTSPDDTIVLQFFVSIDGSCYGSELISCVFPSGSFIPGVCDGGQELTITSGIFLLNFLFLGGPTPPCAAACDCNGDGSGDISDASCVFNFLFLGGPPPEGWMNGQPACIPVGDGDCETPNPACAGG